MAKDREDQKPAPSEQRWDGSLDRLTVRKFTARTKTTFVHLEATHSTKKQSRVDARFIVSLEQLMQIRDEINEALDSLLRAETKKYESSPSSQNE